MRHNLLEVLELHRAEFTNVRRDQNKLPKKITRLERKKERTWKEQINLDQTRRLGSMVTSRINTISRCITEFEAQMDRTNVDFR
jgi:uncharacterized protein YdcH (DUF465 family)